MVFQYHGTGTSCSSHMRTDCARDCLRQRRAATSHSTSTMQNLGPLSVKIIEHYFFVGLQFQRGKVFEGLPKIWYDDIYIYIYIYINIVYIYM